MNPTPTDRSWVRQFGLFGAIVSEMVGGVGVGAALGFFVKKKLGWPFGAVVVGALVGFLVAIYRVYLLVQKEMQ